MEFPTQRRDQIVMGLSICALILFMANIATFVKQRFFDDSHQVRHAFHVQGFGDAADGWDVHVHADGNSAWAIGGQDVDCERRHREHVVDGERRHRHERRARYAWRFENGVLEKVHGDDTELVDIDRLLEEARRAARTIERDLEREFEAPRLEVESLFDEGVEVIESQDETGRHRYRIVVRPEN